MACIRKDLSLIQSSMFVLRNSWSSWLPLMLATTEYHLLHSANWRLIGYSYNLLTFGPAMLIRFTGLQYYEWYFLLSHVALICFLWILFEYLTMPQLMNFPIQLCEWSTLIHWRFEQVFHFKLGAYRERLKPYPNPIQFYDQI